MGETGNLGVIMAIANEMVAEGWGERGEDERITEFRKRLLVAMGRTRKVGEREVVTTASGQIVLPIGGNWKVTI